MKKTFFSLFVLLVSITASATVTVTPLSVDYANKKVTFRVAWTGNAANNRVWVWVDLCPVAGTSPGAFAKAVISTPSAIAGSIETVAGNNRGFYVKTNPSTVTATLDNADGKFNWCAYGSDFPPNAVDNGSRYTLKGSPPFIINGSTEWSANTYSGGTINSLTDATGCPGLLCGKNGESTGLLDCCVRGTTNCNRTCKTNGTYTDKDGACTGDCNTAYVQEKDQCGKVQNPKKGTYYNDKCGGCVPARNLNCNSNQGYVSGVEDCDSACFANATGYKYYNWYWIGDACSCYKCN
jgi:hypothetical protein